MERGGGCLRDCLGGRRLLRIGEDWEGGVGGLCGGFFYEDWTNVISPTYTCLSLRTLRSLMKNNLFSPSITMSIAPPRADRL